MRTIPLHLVIDLGGGSELYDSVPSDVDPVSVYPGSPVDYDVTDEPQEVRPVWIGVSADGTDAQAYPINTPIATIKASWPRIYQGTEIVNPGSVQVFSENFDDVEFLIEACCATGIATDALALKQSPAALTPGQRYPCGTEAIFKWLAILGNPETRTLNYSFQVLITSNDITKPPLQKTLTAGEESLLATVQLVKKWPDDFIGMMFDGGETLVANDVIPGAMQYNVRDYDNGTIQVIVTIIDVNTVEIVESDIKDFALPDTDCISESESAPSGEFLAIPVDETNNYGYDFWQMQLWDVDGNVLYDQTELTSDTTTQVLQVPASAANILIRFLVFNAIGGQDTDGRVSINGGYLTNTYVIDAVSVNGSGLPIPSGMAQVVEATPTSIEAVFVQLIPPG